ncbi:MAG: DUF4336 domain-containing protein [Deltaproteobacteria bacterium]|nr:DUF4336 domain-containing protein [Deltaproteobacteria bacterium]
MLEYIPTQIWLKEYPIRYAGTRFNSRMTLIRLQSGALMLHSPCEIDASTKAEIETLGKVEFIIAPGSYHYFHVASAQAAFPEAATFICPGVEKKRRELHFDGILGDQSDPRWKEDFEQVLVRGNKYIWEVAFYHIPSKTLILVDVLENITDKTEGINWLLKFWWKVVFRMWNNPKPAPEYQLGWKDKKAAGESLRQILDWDFKRIILAHGDLVEENAKGMLIAAWKGLLRSHVAKTTQEQSEKHIA